MTDQSAKTHGTPCWYELTTRDTAASQAFYGALLGWAYQDAGMEGFDYTLAMAGEAMVAGLLRISLPSLSKTAPPKAFINAEWK